MQTNTNAPEGAAQTLANRLNDIAAKLTGIERTLEIFAEMEDGKVSDPLYLLSGVVSGMGFDLSEIAEEVKGLEEKAS